MREVGGSLNDGGDKHPLHAMILLPDTDVFLILIACYKSLPFITYFSIEAAPYVGALDVKLSAAILAFHLFTGCDQSGRFSGKTKLSWSKSFRTAYAGILEALSSLEGFNILPDDIIVENMDRFGSHI